MDWKCDIIEKEQKFSWVLENINSIITIKIKEEKGKYCTIVNKYVKKSGNNQKQSRHNNESNSLLKAFSHVETVLSQYS